jgi:hypothetical protein
VEEVASLTVGSLDLRRGKLLVKSGKGAKDRVVYVSPGAHETLTSYLDQRSQSRAKLVFLVEKGRCRGQPISARGIQKRIEYYAKESGLKVPCHHLRHAMATQLLNADADITIIQDFLGHSRITTTQGYCKVSNRKVERDYYRAIDLVVKRTSPQRSEPAPGQSDPAGRLGLRPGTPRVYPVIKPNEIFPGRLFIDITNFHRPSSCPVWNHLISI